MVFRYGKGDKKYGQLLSEDFPRQENDTNELPDKLQLID